MPGAESQGRHPIHGTVDAGGAPVVKVSVGIRPENHSLEDSPFARQPQGCSGEDTVTALGCHLVAHQDGDGVGVAEALAVAHQGDAEAVVAERGGEDLADLVGVAR